MTDLPKLPSWLERRPPMPTDPSVLRAFDELFDATVARGPGSVVDYNLAAPRWQFICHIADTRPVLLHGSGNPEITRFEPRQPNDLTEFGNQKGVYAASDGLWPMYFAILDRANHPMWLNNTSVRFDLGDGRQSEPYYYFSISQTALDKRPYHTGTLYFLPRDTFHQQPAFEVQGVRGWAAHWASPEPVLPLARISVRPEDFPLRMRGHDDELTLARAKANPDGFPWVDD